MAERAEIVGMGELILNLGLGDSLSNADAALLEMIKRQVEDRIRKYCRWGITQKTYTQYLPSTTDSAAYTGREYVEISGDQAYFSRDYNGGDILQLPNLYVSSITSLYEDRSAKGGQGATDFAEATLLESGVDYWLDKDDGDFSIGGHVVKEAGSWSRKQRTIKITYVSGFTATQLDEEYRDIKQACILETRKWYKRAKSGHGNGNAGAGEIKQESIGGEYTVQYVTSEDEKMGSLSGQSTDLLKPYRRMSLI